MSQQFVGANNGLRLLTFIISPQKNSWQILSPQHLP